MGRPTTMTVYQFNGNNYCGECVAYPVAEALGVGEWAVDEDIINLPPREALRWIARQVGARQKDVIQPLDNVTLETFCSDCHRHFLGGDIA